MVLLEKLIDNWLKEKLGIVQPPVEIDTEKIIPENMAGVNPNLLLEAEEVSLGGPPPQAASSATNYYENMEELLLVDSVDYSSQNVAVLSVLLALALIANLSAFPVILFRRTRCKHLMMNKIYWFLTSDLATASLPVSSSVSLCPTFSQSLVDSLEVSYLRWVKS